MQAYVLRRLLLMIPTFVGISLLLFLILNLAPGRPGAQSSGDLAQSMRGEVTQESFRIFREQFHLDKPTFFNARFALTSAEIERDVSLAAGLDPNATSADRIRAQEELEDLGSYSVPHLVKLLDSKNPRLRDAAGYFLRLNALRPLVDPFNPSPSPEVRATNQAIDRENARLRTLRYAIDADEPTKLQVLAELKRWYAEHEGRYHHGLGKKVAIFFTDTRFYAYWRNLLRFDFGVSLTSREPVVKTLLSKLKYSLSLSGTCQSGQTGCPPQRWGSFYFWTG
jgi:hypothetical protein